MFTAIVPVYNAKDATELTLRTLQKVGKSFLKEILVIDNSTEVETTKFLSTFPDIKHVVYPRSKDECTHAHANAVEHGLSLVKTPYFLLSDSDVEFFSNTIFKQAVAAFGNARIFLVGHMKPQMDMGPYIEAPGLESTGVWFFRTNTVRLFFRRGITFSPKFTTVADRTIRHDFGAFLTQSALAEGYLCDQNLDRESFYHFGAMSRYPESIVKLESNKVMQNELNNRVARAREHLEQRLLYKPWEKL